VTSAFVFLNCTAGDGSGNTSTARFAITVKRVRR
jgi:hypothetical protein